MYACISLSPQSLFWRAHESGTKWASVWRVPVYVCFQCTILVCCVGFRNSWRPCGSECFPSIMHCRGSVVSYTFNDTYINIYVNARRQRKRLKTLTFLWKKHCVYMYVFLIICEPNILNRIFWDIGKASLSYNPYNQTTPLGEGTCIYPGYISRCSEFRFAPLGLNL